MRAAAALALLLLAGCTQRIERADIIGSWIGHPLSAVVAQWGEPVQREPHPGGRERVVWITGKPPQPGFHPSIIVSNDPYTGGRSVAAQLDNWCERSLWLDAAGIVRNGEFYGPACPIYERADRPVLTRKPDVRIP